MESFKIKNLRDFIVKKKAARRMYCDKCVEFDAHDTEDCTIRCSKIDLPAPKDDKKKLPLRKYCDHCEKSKLNKTVYEFLT